MFTPQLVSPTSAQTLPSDWSFNNVGNPAIAGSASYSGGTFTISGAGSDIWNTADQFAFVNRQVSGDVTIIARVATLQNVHEWSKAGVMIRESLAADSKHAFVLATPGNGIEFQRRTTTGGTSDRTTGGTGTAPVWLKLERRSSTFTGYRSADGVTWSTIGSATVSMGSTVYVGMAVTSHDPTRSTTATFSNVSAPGSLPAGWTSSDVGGPAVQGIASFSAGTFTVSGAGSDIYGASDQFRFVYQQQSGDLDVVSRVTTLQNVHPWTKGGVMLRNVLDGSSPEVALFITPGNGVTFQYRLSSGAQTSYTTGSPGQAPVWLKLQRRGSTVTAFRSADGASWTTVAQQSVTLSSTFYAGLAVTSHEATRLATATFDNVAVLPVSASGNQAPLVSLTAPTAGAAYTSPADMWLAATASDPDGKISRVEFYAGATLLDSDPSSPYEYTWRNVPVGVYAITAVARDQQGATTTSAARTVTVSSVATNQAPLVSLTAPAAGATYTAPASISIAASASDADGTVTKVEFYAGSTLIGSDTTAPYTMSWNNVPAGQYSLTAVARDNAGGITVSGTRDIRVDDPQFPDTLIFIPSTGPSSAVDRYFLEIFPLGADWTVANPVGTQDLGKPAVVNGECRVDISQTVVALAPGSYVATVTAIGSSGSSQSAPSTTFVR